MLWLKVVLLISLAAFFCVALIKKRKRNAAIESHVVNLDLHQSRALNDHAVSCFCSRLGQGQSNIAALVEIIAVTRNHIASLEGRPSEKKIEASISRTFFDDAKRIYRTTGEVA